MFSDQLDTECTFSIDSLRLSTDSQLTKNYLPLKTIKRSNYLFILDEVGLITLYDL